MPGLSASELPPEALHAGDTVEYFSRAFVSGDPRGHRRAVVTRVDGDPDAEFPIAVDTCEPVPTDMMVKRVADRFSAPIQAGESLWRKLRTFDLVPGASEAPSQASALNKALAGAVAAAVEAVREAVKDAVDEIVPETPQSSVCSSPEPSVDIDDEPAPSAPSSAIPALPAARFHASGQQKSCPHV
ncbi:hypothetical protein BBJ28_00004328 [Nothophytophthora sp. Chile5]|nr:hypothetical protein BBJ28_00004328 [Nothophytophthora sp. Chile5]